MQRMVPKISMQWRWVELKIVFQHLVSVRTFGVMNDISQLTWGAQSGPPAGRLQMTTLIFLKWFCVYIWAKHTHVTIPRLCPRVSMWWNLWKLITFLDFLTEKKLLVLCVHLPWRFLRFSHVLELSLDLFRTNYNVGSGLLNRSFIQLFLLLSSSSLVFILNNSSMLLSLCWEKHPNCRKKQ